MLQLQFSIRAGCVEVSCDEDATSHLRLLRNGFSTSTSISNVAFDVEIDDLLLNLYELAQWPPNDLDVRWQQELLTLVEGNADDADVMSRSLAVSKGDGEAESGDIVIGGGWAGDLTDFQSRDLAKLLSLAHGANFSVPGAGKTRVALALFQIRRDVGKISRALVICPKSAFESWQSEAAICFPGAPLRVAIMDSAVIPPGDILLTNYERLPGARARLLPWLRAAPALMILDEAHRMKRGPSGAWGTACLSLGPYAAGRLILTGTPAPNGAADLGNVLAFVWPGQGRSAVSRAVDGNDMRTASRLLRPLFVRTTKNELQLPPVDIAVRRLDLPPLHRELYDALLGQESGRLSRDTADAAALGRVLLYLLMAATSPALLATGASRHEPLPYRIPPLQVSANSNLAALLRDLPHYELSPKYREVVGMVAANAKAGRKTIVWSTFVRNLNSLESLLGNFGPSVIHGGTADRAEKLERFRTSPDCMVLLSNPATLGEGVSLHHACHDAIYIDRDFAAGRYLQSLDRIHRLGLAPGTRTRITILIANATIDEFVEQRLASKLRFMGGVLDDPAVLQLADLDEEPDATAGMDNADLRALLGYFDANAPR